MSQEYIEQQVGAIQDAIVRGEMGAHMVFTKMRELVNAATLRQAAQAVDVGAIREVIATLERVSESPCRLDVSFLSDEADKLTRALAGEKAGWRGLTDEEKGTVVGQICEFGTGFVSPLFAVIDKVEAMLQQRNLPASPTPDKEGKG